MTDFPRAKVEWQDGTGPGRCFKLTLRSDNFKLGTDGSLHIWIDRADVSNLQLDCSNTLLDHDIETGTIKVANL